MKKQILIDAAEKKSRESSAEKRLRTLLKTDFPTKIDIGANYKKSVKKELPGDPEFKRRWGDLLNIIPSLNGKTDWIFNVCPSLSLDVLGFKIRNHSLADYLKDRRTRFEKIPTRTLVEVEIPSFKNQTASFDFIHYFSVYCELRALTAIIDVGMEQDPSMLFSKKGIDWIWSSDKALFLKLIQRDPIFLQSLAGLLKIKIQMNFFSKNENDLDFFPKFKRPSPRYQDITAFRRALFLIAVFDKEILSTLPYKTICAVFEETGVCLKPTEDMCKKEIPRLWAVVKSDFAHASQSTFFTLEERKLARLALKMTSFTRKEALHEVTLHRGKGRKGRSKTGVEAQA